MTGMSPPEVEHPRLHLGWGERRQEGTPLFWDEPKNSFGARICKERSFELFFLVSNLAGFASFLRRRRSWSPDCTPGSGSHSWAEPKK